jgi:hypothetical protein
MENLEAIMKNYFSRQNSGDAPAASTHLDFGAATAKRARVFEPGDYRLRIESARVIHSKQNILVALDLIETESSGRVDSQPMWVDGPNAAAGDLAAENKHLIAELLTLHELPTAGNVYELIPQLAGLEFVGRLVLARDSRTGRTHNALADIYADDGP